MKTHQTKSLFILACAVLLGVAAQAAEKVVSYTLPEVKAQLLESTAWPGNFVINAEGFLQPSEPLGAPMLPFKTVSVAVPSGCRFVETRVEADWTVLSEKVKILPVQKPVPVSEDTVKPDFVAPSSEAGAKDVAMAKVEKITGLDIVLVNLTPFKYDAQSGRLEVARNLKLSVVFAAQPVRMSTLSTSTSTSPLTHPDYVAATLSTLVNPDDAAPEVQKLMAAATGTAVDYLMVSPPALYDTWKWYIGERKKNHPTLTFDIINTYDAYNTYPFKGWVKDGVETTDGTYANPAESLHAYLTQYARSHALKYVVLGGSWYDVTADNSEAHYLQDGTEITLEIAVPGICMECHGGRAPTDLFYGCVTRGNDNPGHPWDYNGDGRYLTRILDVNGSIVDHESEHCNLRPDFAVSRMTMKPITVNGETMNQHLIITNFVKKVNRAEDLKFVGNFKMGLTSSPLNYTPRDMSDGIVRREEVEFFDCVPNMYDPNHNYSFRDDGPVTRRHAREIMAPKHPIIDAMGFHEPDIVSHNSTKDTFYNDFYHYDKETGSNNGHGWAGGSSMFNATQFLTQPGLTKINIVGISCETGYPDLYGRVNGKLVLNLCLGEAGLANITETGGFIASMNNSRVGLSYFETEPVEGKGLSNRMHYHMCHYVAEGQCAGEAWLSSVRQYLSDGNSGLPVGRKNINEGGLYCMMVEMLYGDPLIKLAETSDYTWNGGSEGDWDMTSANWTKAGASSTFYHANNINFSVLGGASITMKANAIPEELGRTELPYGGMTMNVTQNSGSTFELKGTSSLRLMKDLNVSGGTLKIGVSGGVGLGGINFSQTGDLVLDNNNEGKKYYFINSVRNARSIAFKGGGAILDLGGIDNTLQSLIFDGQDPLVSTNNVLRTNQQKKKGDLVRFLPLSLRNIALTLETYEAFDGFNGETLATLDHAVLTFRQNRWRGLKGYTETVNKKLVMTDSTLAVDATSDFYLDATTLEMSGKCGLLTTHGGVFNLKGTTTVRLAEGAVCRLDAKFDVGTDEKLVFEGVGRVVVGNAEGLSGTIRIGSGVTLELERLPLSNLSRLEFADGTTIVVPYEDGNFYQVVPIASAMVVEGAFTVKVKGLEEGEIIAEHTQTGTIFQSGTLLEWISADEVWTSEKTFKPWRKNGEMAAFDSSERVYFPDIEGGLATVQLATSIVSPFTCFANSATRYTFKRTSTAPDATLTFDSLVIGGWTHFALPLFFNTRLYVSGGDFEGTEIVSPVVEVAAGGVFEGTALRGAGDDASLVTIAEGGVFTLAGSHKMNLELKPGAKFKAENGKCLDWNGLTKVIWPEDGSKVKIDVNDFTPSVTPEVIICGVGQRWDMQELRRLEVEGESCSLAVVGGALCLVRRDDIAAPYALTVDSASVNWDNAAWTGGGVAFPKKWSENNLDWMADGVITVAQNDATLTLAVPARFNTLRFVPADESVANFTFTIAEGGELKAGEVHFEGFTGVVTVNNLELNEGELYTSTEMHLKGPSSGVLVSGGNDTITIYEPSEKWILGEGAQGTLRVAITDRVKASRQKVLTIAESSLWPIGGLDFQIVNPLPNGRTEGFFASREGVLVYLVPPEIHAFPTTGVVNWTDLTWYAYDESEVEIADWSDVYAARLESQADDAVVIVDVCPTTQVTIGPATSASTSKALALRVADGAPVKLPGMWTMNGDVTVEGDILPMLDYVTGEGMLTLKTGGVTEIVLSGNISPVESGHVEVKSGSRLVLHHTQYFSSTTADWSGLVGDGEVEIVGDGNYRFLMPVVAKMFASTLSLVQHSELELQRSHVDVPVQVSNLSGSGVLGIGGMTAMKFFELCQGNGATATALSGVRRFRTTQSKVTEWNGTIPPGMKLFSWVINVKLIVASSESVPSVDRRLIYSGMMSRTGDQYSDCTHPLEIESSGCLELNGYWNGDITNNGLLIMGRNGQVNGSGNLKGSGYITTNGDVIDLTGDSGVASKYRLYSGTSGTIRFNVASFSEKTEVISVQDGFTLGDAPLTLVAVGPNDEVRWKAVTLDDIENGKLVWKTEGTVSQSLAFDLAAGESDFAALVGDVYLGGVSSLTFNGAVGGSQVAITDQIRQFTGTLVLNNGVTLLGLPPSLATLAANPVGKLVFAVQDAAVAQDLMLIAPDFTYDPDKFTVEVRGPNGETNAMGTWTQRDGKLLYCIADIDAVTTGLAFDQNYNSFGSRGITNLGSPNFDVFTETHDGYGVKAEKANNHCNNDNLRFYLGSSDWSFAWCARLGSNANAVHFSLGTSDAGLALTTVDANHVALSRWGGGNSFQPIITAEVLAATARFYSYVVTYRKGRYTLYVNGVEVGSALDLRGTAPLPELVKWQFFSVCGGGVGANSADGILDDVRAYDLALPAAAIQALADEFPAWPDAVETVSGMTTERNVNDFGTAELGNDIYLTGDGTLRLYGIGEARLCLIRDRAQLVIADGVTVRVAISANNLEPLKGHEVVIEHGGRLVFEHAEDLQKFEECNLANISGEGTVEFRATADGKYIYPPVNSFASTLSFCNNTTIYLDRRWTQTYPFKVRNLSGSGSFRYDTANAGYRWILATQSEHTSFTGSFPKGAGNAAGHITLTVTSDETVPDYKRSLILAPANVGGLFKVAIESAGCVAFEQNAALGSGETAATLDDDGLVVFAPRSNEEINLNSYRFERPTASRIALSGNGVLVVNLESKQILAPSPVGVINAVIPEDAHGVLALIRVDENFTFSPATFRVAGSLLGKDLEVAGGWLCAAANASAGGTDWSTESGEWSANGFNNGIGATSGKAASFSDAVSTVDGSLVNAVTVTVNEAVAADSLDFNGYATGYTLTGSGSIDSAIFSFIADGAPVTLNGVTLACETIELIVPTTVAVGTKLIGWSNPYANTFTSAMLESAGLTLDKRTDGLYVIEKPANLDDMRYHFNDETQNYKVTDLEVSSPSITIACSVKSSAANQELWSETLSSGGMKIRVGLKTGSSPTTIKFFYDYIGTISYPCGEVDVPYADQQTHTYIITFDNTVRKWSFYVDGEKRGESPEKSQAFFYNGQAYSYAHAVAASATIADWRMYMRLLNESEIKAYKKLFPKYPILRRPPTVLFR